jgi:hypothetical protein
MDLDDQFRRYFGTAEEDPEAARNFMDIADKGSNAKEEP